ncbi:MAG: hydantoinase B/oxoprolinase family protein [Candidatus Rokubacteria bacterium]|nr:hydantoinase B/oxoprolinase family protein [Candidatus Rokubacteria bacterium]
MAAFDPVTLEVLWNRLISIVDETGATLQRTSFSTIVRESNDFACVILDPLGRSLAQSVWSVPSFTGTLPITLRHMLAEHPAVSLEPGDSLITNDPWMGTGHLPDLTIVTPIFRDRRLVAFVGSIAHSPDMGGSGLSGESREVYEEGLQIPILKLCQRGELNPTLVRLLRANVRVPDQVLGDLHAQLAANATGGRRLLGLMDERGLDDLIPLAEELHGRSEAAMRAAIAQIPDGEYRHVVMTDGFDAPIEIHCSVGVRGSDIHIDYAGTSRQIERGINCVMNYTYAYSLFAVKCLTNPLIPNNEGGFRPVRVTAPEGCILNPTYPAAVGSRAQMGHFLPSAIFGALAPVIPQRVAADSGSPLWGPVFSGTFGGRKFSDIYFFNGGQGARPGSDGIHCLSFPSNISNTPLEVFENNVPVRFEEKSLLPDSGGAGRFRGGCGQRVVLTFLADTLTAVAMRMDRISFPPQGFHGGGAGATGLIVLNETTALHPKRKYFMKHGDCVRFHTPGGGGLFPPETRDPQRVLEDVRNGIVSLDAAEQVYRVAIRKDGSEVDRERTRQLRKRARG